MLALYMLPLAYIFLYFAISSTLVLSQVCPHVILCPSPDSLLCLYLKKTFGWGVTFSNNCSFVIFLIQLLRANLQHDNIWNASIGFITFILYASIADSVTGQVHVRRKVFLKFTFIFFIASKARFSVNAFFSIHILHLLVSSLHSTLCLLSMLFVP